MRPRKGWSEQAMAETRLVLARQRKVRQAAAAARSQAAARWLMAAVEQWAVPVRRPEVLRPRRVRRKLVRPREQAVDR